MPKKKSGVSLEKEVDAAIQQWEDHISLDYEDSVSLTQESEISVHLYPGEQFSSTVGKFLDMVRAANVAKFTSNGVATVGDDTYLRVCPYGERTSVFFSMIDESIAETHGLDGLETSFDDVDAIKQSLTTTFDTEFGKYKCRVSIGPSPLTLIAYRDIGFDKYFHPQLSDEVFIVVENSKHLKIDDIENIVDAFLFELSASHSLVLIRNQYPDTKDYWNWFENAESIAKEFAKSQILRLRPLQGVSGTGQLLTLYTRANSAQEVEYSLLNYVKVIEFVSVSVERIGLHKELRNYLLDARALSPDADFISEMVESMNAIKLKSSKDSDRMTAAVMECCDMKLLVDLVPRYLDRAKKDLRSSNGEQVMSGSKYVAQSLIATRNAISHAKPNYAPTGTECPVGEYQALNELAKKIAECCIRWYLGLAAHQRVSRSQQKL